MSLAWSTLVTRMLGIVVDLPSGTKGDDAEDNDLKRILVNNNCPTP
jgi:hypothetical protein